MAGNFARAFRARPRRYRRRRLHIRCGCQANDVLGARPGLTEQLDDTPQRHRDLACHIGLIVALLVAPGLAGKHDPLAGTIDRDAVRKAAGF